MKLLTWRELADRASVSVSTVKRLHKEDPNFPRKLRISPGRVGFVEDEADAWMASLAEQTEV